MENIGRIVLKSVTAIDKTHSVFSIFYSLAGGTVLPICSSLFNIYSKRLPMKQDQKYKNKSLHHLLASSPKLDSAKIFAPVLIVKDIKDTWFILDNETLIKKFMDTSTPSSGSKNILIRSGKYFISNTKTFLKPDQ